jgi:predicted GNAT family acetyltransferase
MSAAPATVVDNPAELRYELWTAGAMVGFILYTLEDGTITLAHTDIDPAHEGQGLGNVLVRGALDDIRSRGLKLHPLCPFVIAYLKRHPEDADLTARR